VADLESVCLFESHVFAHLNSLKFLSVVRTLIMAKPRYEIRWIAPLSVGFLLAFQAALFAANDWDAKELAQPFPKATTERELIEQLRTATPEGKAVACKQLSIYGTKAAVPELAKLLADEHMSSWARIALEAIPDPEADAALIDAAGKLQGARGSD
jgi:hypothetical protein